MTRCAGVVSLAKAHPAGVGWRMVTKSRRLTPAAADTLHQ